MGKQRKLKQARRAVRQQERLAKAQAKTAKRLCEGCAFGDEEAFVADIELANKVRQSATKGIPFYCHEGMELQILPNGDTGEYLPPTRADGSIDTTNMELCGGYLRFMAVHGHKSLAAIEAAVAQLQRRQMQRFLQTDSELAQDLRKSSQGRADILQQAIQQAAAKKALDRFFEHEIAQATGDQQPFTHDSLCHAQEDARQF